MLSSVEQQIFEEIIAPLGVTFDSSCPFEIIQQPGYIDSPVATHDFATATLATLDKATATIGQMRGLGSQTMRIDRRPHSSCNRRGGVGWSVWRWPKQRC